VILCNPKGVLKTRHIPTLTSRHQTLSSIIVFPRGATRLPRSEPFARVAGFAAFRMDSAGIPGPRESPLKGPADALRRNIHRDIEVSVDCLLPQDSSRRKYLRLDAARSVEKVAGPGDIFHADTDMPELSGEAPEGKVQAPLDVDSERLFEILAFDANVEFHGLPFVSFLDLLIGQYDSSDN
jgi:hypothetical protein